jgi:phosphoglycolate phosphatase-like HAD superfamily hydrolase
MEPTRKKPIVISLGKNSRRRIKKLKRGQGRLMDDVRETLAELKAAGTIAADAEPVVFIVKQRAQSSSMPCLPMPMPKLFS